MGKRREFRSFGGRSFGKREWGREESFGVSEARVSERENGEEKRVSEFRRTEFQKERMGKRREFRSFSEEISASLFPFLSFRNSETPKLRLPKEYLEKPT